MRPTDRGVSRREFVAAAVAIGGSNALAACLQRERDVDDPSTEEPTHPQGPSDLSRIPDWQHEWGHYLVRDAHGNTRLPRHQIILLLDYTGSAPPTDEDRSAVEGALRTLDRAVQRGTGGSRDAVVNEGLLYTIGYSPAYFDRIGYDLPDSVDLQPPSEVLSTLGEKEAAADEFDAAIILTSDHGSVVLEAEKALLGNADRLNGVEVEGSVGDAFELAERRTGVLGRDIVREETGEESIPESSPMSMGFRSGFEKNLATEDRVTIEGGPFAGGTTQMISRMRIEAGRWHDRDENEKVQKMFSPDHSAEELGPHADQLASDSAISEDTVEDVERHAKEHGCVGHTQKAARARDGNFEPLILRRSESVATDVDEDGVVGMNFSSVQETVADFVETREAMNSPDLDDHLDPEDHGILDFVDVTNRATFLVPPKELRALPDPGA